MSITITGRRPAAALLCVALAGACAAAPEAVPRYRLVDLGAGTLATGLNDAGDVFGRVLLRAEIWRAGAWTPVARPPLAVVPRTASINASDASVGTLDDGSQSTAVLWKSSGRLVQLIPDAGDNVSTQAFDIADDGTVVGGSNDVATSGAFAWHFGQVTWLPLPSGMRRVTAQAINAAHQIAGTASDDAHSALALFSAGTWQVEPGVPGSGAWAADLNASGQVVGATWAPGAPEHASAWDGLVATDFGTLGGEWSEARGVNDDGVIVGRSLDASGLEQAFVIVHGRMRRLVDLVDFPQGATDWQLHDAVAINASGQIAGNAFAGNDGGNSHAYLLTPVSR
jgi:probable HAF family extracellular repeat protein